jgi:hypothetical protein
MAVPWEDRLFYAEIAGGPAVAGVGPFMIWDWHHPYIGYGLIVLGLVAFIHALFPNHSNKRGDLNRRRFVVVMGVLILTWASVLYDFYDHHMHSSAPLIVLKSC